jgi:hypothetical protein
MPAVNAFGALDIAERLVTVFLCCNVPTTQPYNTSYKSMFSIQKLPCVEVPLYFIYTRRQVIMLLIHSHRAMPHKALHKKFLCLCSYSYLCYLWSLCPDKPPYFI